MGLGDLFGGGDDKVSKYAKLGGMLGPLGGGIAGKMLPFTGLPFAQNDMANQMALQFAGPGIGAAMGGGGPKQAANAMVGYHPGVSFFDAMSGKPTGAGIFGGDPMQASLGQNVGKLGAMTAATLGGVGAAGMAPGLMGAGAAPSAPMMAMKGGQMAPQLMQFLMQLMNRPQQRSN